MTSIFVTKLDFNTTDTELKTLFEQYGKVNRVTIAKDRETGKPRGFAFVEMFNEAEAEAAIRELDNASVNGRTITVKKADDRSSRPPGGNSQGGGFNRTDNRGADRPQFNRTPRTDSQQGDFKPQERPPRREDTGGGFAAPAPAFDSPAKTERKKEPKVAAKKSTSDQPKQHKMEAYKKSGKSNRFFDDDDDLEDDWQSHRREMGWDEEE